MIREFKAVVRFMMLISVDVKGGFGKMLYFEGKSKSRAFLGKLGHMAKGLRIPHGSRFK